ncbi:hypothetical protein AK812_SmicGene43795 [Symbiodinium microadriaticum]|uniref:Uncharacterized protein n=1 Tax=Symbiodinium microadriaticum TaxID=2951 RepID=A0A1Q9C098_SYMMI|nr:hypothetical protein AK812_SmicGene43795 [Symbiodinium microadriaticum]
MADGPALIPLAKSVIYLGTYLIWRACAVSSATFGLTPLGMTYPAATLLRGWFYKQLRAVTNTPAHLSHVSNAALSTKHGIPDPIDQLEQSIQQKRDKLQTKENDITNTTDIQEFWEQTHLAYKELTTKTLQDSPVVPVPPTVTGLACPECGVYFPSTKWPWQVLGIEPEPQSTQLASPALSKGLNFQGRASFAELLTRRPPGSTPPSASRFFSFLSCATMSETSAAMWEVAQMWGAHSQMNEDQSDDELQPTKFPKKAGKGAGKLEKRPREPQTAPPRGPKQAHLLTLARMMARHEMALQQLEADRSWVIFVDSGSLGIINQLMLTTATWKKQRSKNECSCSLRQALMGAMLMELEDPLRWQYTKWNSEKKTHEPTNGAPLAHTTALTALRELKSLILQEGTMHAFHAMGGMSEEKEGVTLFKLTLSMEAPAKVTIREILTQFTESSMLRLIGARLRPERYHSAAPQKESLAQVPTFTEGIDTRPQAYVLQSVMEILAKAVADIEFANTTAADEMIMTASLSKLD